MSQKLSIRLSLNDDLRNALALLRQTRYPFLKDDEIFKLAFSKLFANETITSNRQTTVSNILSKLRSIDPNFAKDWLAERELDVKDMDVLTLCEMIIDLSKKDS